MTTDTEPPRLDIENSRLTIDDVHTIIGHAVALRLDGKEDMPRYFLGLAERIAELLGDAEFARKTRAVGVSVLAEVG